MKQLLLLNPYNVPREEAENYPVREAARAIVFDDEKNIALIHVSDRGYYKLPGGGIEGDENHLLALQRECEEEIGCGIEMLGEIGTIIEYRKLFGIKQISYCYLAKVQGQKGEPRFTEEEVANGFERIWVQYSEALKLITGKSTTDTEGRDYIVPRDIAFLEAAKDKI